GKVTCRLFAPPQANTSGRPRPTSRRRTARKWPGPAPARPGAATPAPGSGGGRGAAPAARTPQREASWPLPPGHPPGSQVPESVQASGSDNQGKGTPVPTPRRTEFTGEARRPSPECEARQANLTATL